MVKLKRILITRTDRFGEFLLIIPLIRALARAYPQARITLLVSAQVAPLARCIEGVAEIIIWDNAICGFKELWGFSRSLRVKHFDACVVCNPVKELHLLAFLSGIPVRVGYARKWGFLLTHRVKDKKYLGRKHEIAYNLDLLVALGLRSSERELDLIIPEQDRGRADNLLGEFTGAVAVHAFTSDTLKQWPFEYFQGLVRQLAVRMQVPVVLVGGQEERPQAKLIYDGSFPGVRDLIGKTTLVELAAVLKKCRVLVTGDSGPMHLAACVGTPVVAIFRNDLPGKTAVRWGPAGRKNIVVEDAQLSGISVERVLDTVRKIIN